MKPTTIGLDIAKRSFQIHGVDDAGAVVVQRPLTRGRLVVFFAKLEPCLIGTEACATAHHWARELQALGHEVRLIPPAYVKPYVRRSKSDAADAAAICEAVSRPHMRFVPIKTQDQQAAQSLTRVRDQLVSQRTGSINALRAHLAEFGIVAARGLGSARMLRAVVREDTDRGLPKTLRDSLTVLVEMLEVLDAKIAELERQIREWHKSNAVSRRLTTIPGIGVLTASAFTAAVPDPGYFRSGREFAAWLGLTPRQHSTGGKVRLGGISKRGNPRLRGLLIICASSVIEGLKRRKDGFAKAPWRDRLRATKSPMVVTVALANKLARTLWAIMSGQTCYRAELGFVGA